MRVAKTRADAPATGVNLCNNGRQLQAFRKDVHPNPDPAAGVAQTNAAAPFSNHALCNDWLLLALRNDAYPEPVRMRWLAVGAWGG